MQMSPKLQLTMHNRTPRTMAEAFGHHSNNTIWIPRPPSLKKRFGMLGLVVALIAIVITVAVMAFVRFAR